MGGGGGGLIIWMLLLFASPVLAETPVQRLNYGILFKSDSPVHLATEYWIHAYDAIKMQTISQLNATRNQNKQIIPKSAYPGLTRSK